MYPAAFDQSPACITPALSLASFGWIGGSGALARSLQVSWILTADALNQHHSLNSVLFCWPPAHVHSLYLIAAACLLSLCLNCGAAISKQLINSYVDVRVAQQHAVLLVEQLEPVRTLVM